MPDHTPSPYPPAAPVPGPDQAAPHVPVLLREVLEGLAVGAGLPGLDQGRWIIDGTLGAGGHTQAILDADPGARVLGFDRDPAAIAIAGARLAPYGDRFQAVHASYTAMGEQAQALGFAPADGVDGILIDLGLSSMQLDQAERGFAFRQDGPLDMRFDPTAPGPTAADLVNTLSESALADLFWQLGEEPDSRRIARAIVAGRPFVTTQQLADVIRGAVPPSHRGKIHPATRSFQALRIAVNDELGAVERVLPIAVELLRPGGRLAVITFHSLEDRIVKHFLKQAATDCICPPRQPVCTCGHHAEVRLITRKPISPSDAEVAANPRARSAQLRVAERL